MDVTGHLYYLQGLIDRGGPEQSEYEYLNNITLDMMDLSITEKSWLFDILKPILTINSMIGYTFLKPYGYAGDFYLIYKIYSQCIADEPQYQKWDQFFHSTATAQAIRKRKDYFIQQVIKVASKIETTSVLNLGNGPGVDLFEFFQNTPRSSVKFDCVDMDAHAIEFAKTVCDNTIESITFTQKNVFNYKSEKQFDLIWSAGLFDYINDQLFIRLIKNYYQLLSSEGELIIAGFSEDNPSRGTMKALCQWDIYHRSEQKLLDLVLNAGISKKYVEIKVERKSINFYLHICK